MGAAHNNSIDVSHSARRKASTRTPVHFYLTVPLYEYDLGCGDKEHLHTFQSRTPMVAAEEHDGFCIVWCDRCQNYTKIDSHEPEPLNRPISTDELTAFEQDKGILRERIAMAVQDAGYLEDDGQIMEMAVLHGVPVGEIKKINAGLKAPEIIGQDLCKAGLHEMTFENIKVTKHGRQCLTCYREKDRAAKARRRASK